MVFPAAYTSPVGNGIELAAHLAIENTVKNINKHGIVRDRLLNNEFCSRINFLKNLVGFPFYRLGFNNLVFCCFYLNTKFTFRGNRFIQGMNLK